MIEGLWSSSSGFVGQNEDCFGIKYADNTVIVGLLDDSDDTNGDNCYVQAIDPFAIWCRNNILDFNVLIHLMPIWYPFHITLI